MEDVRLLIVDFDAVFRNMMKDFIVSRSYLVDEAADGIAAIKLFRRNDYHLIVIDTAIPELEAPIVCSQIRKVSDVPIIITGAKGEKEEKLAYYELGVDDFIIKPFSCEELMARIKVFLRRTNGLKNIPSHTVFSNGIHIDTLSRSVTIHDRPISLSPKEYDLLVFLMQNPNKAFSRETLLNEVWGRDFCGLDRTVDTHIKTLREGIRPCQNCIATIWGFGYKYTV